MTTYLITGANRGIGLALATVFAERGDTVITTARDPNKAPALKALADRFPDRVTVHALDVTSNGSALALGKALADKTIDVLVNNAGTIGPDRQSTTDMDFDGFLDALNTNTVGPLRVTQAVLPMLRRSKAAKIITLSSQMGSMANLSSDRIAYRASKAAVNKVMQGLTADLRGDGIACLTVHPGWVRTDMGGSNADIDVKDSVAGLAKRIDDVSLATSGQFLNYDGTTRAW